MQEQQVAWQTGKAKTGRDSRETLEQHVWLGSQRKQRKAVDSRTFCGRKYMGHEKVGMGETARRVPRIRTGV
jgi:hypothetical protein